MRKTEIINFGIFLTILMFACSNNTVNTFESRATKDDGTRLILQESDLEAGTHHLRHAEIFGKYIHNNNPNHNITDHLGFC